MGRRSKAKDRKQSTELTQPEFDAQSDRVVTRNAISKLQRTLGNRAMSHLLESEGLQTKLHISQPGDAEEIEADRVSEEVANEVASVGPGRALDSAVRESVGSRFGQDLSGVKIHTDESAAESARALNARAYTLGSDVVFGRNEFVPQTHAGKKLLAHELTHVVQQKRTRQAAKIHRNVHPEDVSSEMVGRTFTVTGPFTSGSIRLRGGETVTVVAWDNRRTTATVRLRGGAPFDIPKTLLRVASPQVRGMVHFGAGVEAQAQTVRRGEQAIATERSRRGGPRPGEIPRLEGLQQTRQEGLNRRLIQETMFNRFDPIIVRWVNHYNQQFHYTGNNALDPNLVKSMLFQETQMGTSGRHMELPSAGHPLSHPTRTRFNVPQVIDSSAAALLVMIRETRPALISTYHLENINRDLSAAQSELARLEHMPSRSAAEQARLTELERLRGRGGTWETFLWGYRAPGQRTGFWEAANELFTTHPAGQPDLNFDYEFWIRTAIRWLFEKRRGVSSWAEAIRAYNGSGAAARHYRDAVMRRTGAAQAASRRGETFMPGNI